jgi:hypothetical protein
MREGETREIFRRRHLSGLFDMNGGRQWTTKKTLKGVFTETKEPNRPTLKMTMLMLVKW